ncbi:MAG: alpha/beta fold hydrolase [Proteobacteria bacterium]|nr:alpha/beta fold hydrolase [Pseudomonadota bacterium]
MSFDVDLHRITISLPGRLANGKPFEMSVVDAGPRDAAQTIVFLHGFGGRAAYWEYQLEHFQSDYRVIALDLRGHGYTDAPTEVDGAHYDVPELVADIEAALDVLQAPPRFILVCHSFGGALSAYFLSQHPQRVTALVIIASAVQFRLRAAGRLLLRVPPVMLDWLRKALPVVGFNAAHLYPPTHVVYLQNRYALTQWDGTEYLRRIAVPTQVILGQRDTLFSDVSYRQVAQLVPGAEEVVIPVSAHQVMVERPDAVNRAIERFLQAQVDPLVLAEQKAAQRTQRRTARKALEAERPWLKFYDARTPYRIRPPSTPLPRLLEATARRFGKTTALHFCGRAISWRELDRLAGKFAGSLQAAGLRAGERVMLALPNIPQWPIAYFGVLKASGVVVLADVDIEAATLCARLVETRSVMLIGMSKRHADWCAALRDHPGDVRQVILTTPSEYMGWREKLQFALLHHVQEGHHLAAEATAEKLGNIAFLRFRHMVLRGRRLPPDATQSVDDTAIIAYTFGTGGTALPVPLSHRNLAANALQLRHWLPESRPGDERFLAHQPLSSPYGLGGLLHLGVYLGASLILLADNDIPQLLKTVKKMRPTYFPTTPRMVRQLMHTPGVRRFGLASIRVCAVSGSSLPQEVREEFEKITRGRLIEAYGLTEAAPAVLAMPVATRRRAGALGLPLPDTEAKIIDLDSGQVCAPDMPGELWVRGPQVFAGYAGAHAMTAERLRDGWLATGDIASADEDGFFTLIDRKDNMLLRDGQRIFPRQIEEILFEHPAVALAEVKRQRDENGQTQLQAEVILHRNMRIDQEELRQYCAKRLRPSALPDSIHVTQQPISSP